MVHGFYGFDDTILRACAFHSGGKHYLLQRKFLAWRFSAAIYDLHEMHVDGERSCECLDVWNVDS